jgi:hypothetical protein
MVGKKHRSALLALVPYFDASQKQVALAAGQLLEAGADLRTIQVLLGRSKLEHSTVYLHLSRRHLRAIPSPLEAIEVPRPDEAKRSRRRIRR